MDIGRTEARRVSSAWIEREHLLIGLCSLEKLLVPTAISRLTTDEVEAVQSEL
jgi:hypothetical protein